MTLKRVAEPAGASAPTWRFKDLGAATSEEIPELESLKYEPRSIGITSDEEP